MRLRRCARLAPFAACGTSIVLCALYGAALQSKTPSLPQPGRVVPARGSGSSGARSSSVLGIEQLLSNALEAPVREEETLSCVDYSGPCFFMNHPNGDAPKHPVPAARLRQPTLLQPTALPLNPVSLHDVRLLPGTRFHTAQQTNLRWLRSFDLDQLLYWFRNLSGIRQPRGVRPQGGWDGAGLRGHILGHYLSAASMAAAAEGDGAHRGQWPAAGPAGLLRRNLDNLTRGLEACQDALGEDGYVSAFPDAEFRQMEELPAPRYAWVPYYVMHKLLAGLLDYHRLWRARRR